jgi:hypothetical protein
MFNFIVYISSKTHSFMAILSFITLISLYPSNIAVSYGQAGLYSDSPLIAYTTDCIASMMTSTIVGSPQDCTENTSKVTPPSNDASNIIKPENTSKVTPPSNDASNIIKPDNTTPNSMDNANSLSKNNPFYSEFQNTNADTSSFPSTSMSSPDNGLANNDSISPPADNPSTSMSSTQQNPNSTYVIPPSPIESLDGKNNTNNTANEINELGNIVDKNNENGEEISGCFDRASVADASLSDLEIIKCAEDRDSFSDENNVTNENNVNLNVDDEEKPDGNNDESDDARIKEISACFDRAFVPDASLSDLEIIKCAEDRDSFSDENNVTNENNANLDLADEEKPDGNDSDGNDSDGNDSDGNDSDGNDSDGNDK